MRGLALAVGFLTRARVEVVVTRPSDLARSIPWFPVVGAALGALAGVVRWSTGLVLPSLVAAVLAVAAGLAMTGAFHEDGLADTFDGLAAGTDRAVAAMKDPLVGAAGTAALMMALLLKVSLVAVLDGAPAVVGLAAAGAASRGLVGVWAATAAISGAGLAADLRAGATRAQATAAGLLGGAAGLAVGVAGLAGVLAAGASWVPLRRWSTRALGGPTGDVLGAAQVLAELAFLVVIVAARELGGWGW